MFNGIIFNQGKVKKISKRKKGINIFVYCNSLRSPCDRIVVGHVRADLQPVRRAHRLRPRLRLRRGLLAGPAQLRVGRAVPAAGRPARQRGLCCGRLHIPLHGRLLGGPAARATRRAAGRPDPFSWGSETPQRLPARQGPAFRHV